jgi:hypothetical protein
LSCTFTIDIISWDMFTSSNYFCPMTIILKFLKELS